MNKVLAGKELYEGLEEGVVEELVAKFEQDNEEFGGQEPDTQLVEEAVPVDEVKELQVKHAMKHHNIRHIKRKKQRELRNIGVDGYEDNPDKYFNKKTKKTKAVRQSEKELRHKKERQKEAQLKNLV